MQSPEDLRQALCLRFARQHRRWFVEHSDPALALGAWPLDLAVGRPTEQDFITEPTRVRDWVVSWERCDSMPPGVRIVWAERQWLRLGAQHLPERIVLDSVQALAHWVGAGSRWRRAVDRAARLVTHWPALTGHGVLGRVFDALADLADEDFDRLLVLLRWTEANPASGLYLRQLPITGLDTKWIAARSVLATEMLRALRQARGELREGADLHSHDLHSLLGLKRASTRMRVRLLCPTLRALVGGLEDLELPIDQLAALPIEPRTVLIVENLETGLALPDMGGVLAVMKLGAAVKLIAALPWLAGARCLYWGDIDTFGFDILNRARSVVPHLQSVLMDTQTLLDHKSLCGVEPTQSPALELPLLTPVERDVFTGLRSNLWGQRLRLEQERIPWATAMSHLLTAA